MNEPLLKVEELHQHFKVSRNFTVKAVNGVSFEIQPGETFGLVGESGSGKTTIGRSIIRLYQPTRGVIVFNQKKISGTLHEATRRMLRKEMQMIFQDPMSSLNPRKKIGDIIGEGPDIHGLCSGRAERDELIARACRTLPASILRRATPTHRYRPRARHETQADYCRRMHICP